MDDGEDKKEVGLDADYIGMSSNPTIDQLDALKTRIFQGAEHVELGFFGTGKGSMGRQNTTPEMFGKDQRQAMRQMAKLNDVSLSTHATVGVQGLAGRSEQGFVPEAQEAALNELKRSIDFAADVAGGGAVTFHAGEFPRPVSEYEKEGFIGHPTEEEEGIIHLADKKTGQIMSLRKNTPISEPRQKKDENGKLMVDDFGNPIYERNEKGEIIFDRKTYAEKLKEKGEGYTPVQFYRDYLKKEEELNHSQAREYANRADSIEEQRKRITQLKNTYENALKSNNVSDELKGQIIRDLKERGFYPSDRELQRFPEIGVEIHKDPLSFIKQQEQEFYNQEKSYRDVELSYDRRTSDVKEQMENLAPIDKVGLNKTKQGIARAAMYAYEKEKKMGLKDPLFLAPENIWPDTGYGAHPQELKKIINDSRKEMSNLLVQKKGMDKRKAEEVAAEHIKATFDIGHANIWRKYFKGSDKKFDKWLMNQIEDLNKEGIIGHIHVSDNFGFEDEHVTPGQGNAPINEFIKKMKKDPKFKGKIVIEPAHQDYQAWTGAIRHLGSPIYRTQTWTDIEGSYLTGFRSNYMIGAYATDSGLPDDRRDMKFFTALPIE